MKYKEYLIADLIDEISMGPFGSNIKVECFVEEGVPVLNGSNLTGFAMNDDAFRYVTEEKADSLGKANAYRKDIVVTHRGTLGQIVFIPANSKYERYVISQSQFRVKCNEKVLPEYLVYYFHTREGQGKLLSNASQVGVPALARASTTFQKLSVPIPEYEIQKKIVSFLEIVREKIEINNSINKNLYEQVMALYQKMFVETDLNRTLCKAEDFFDISIGKTPPRKEMEWFSKCDSDIRWVSISDMGNAGTYINSTSEFLTPEAVKKFNVVVIPDNTVLLSFKLTVGRIAITNGEMTTNEAIAHFKTNDSYINPYLYCYLKSFNFESLGSTSSIATAINSKIVKAMPFIVPNPEELEDFNKIALPIFELIKTNEAEIRDLALLRDTLLPQLMSGELDISEVNI